MKQSVSITGAGSGFNGAVTETGTTAVTGDFSHIQVLADAVFATFTERLGSGDAMTGFTIAVGTVITGRISAFTLTSGKVRAYKFE